MASEMLVRHRAFSMLLTALALATGAEAQVVRVGPGLYAGRGAVGMQKITSPWGQSLRFYYIYIPPPIVYGPAYYPAPGGYGYRPYQYRPTPYPRYYYSPPPYVGDLGRLYYPTRKPPAAPNAPSADPGGPKEQQQTPGAPTRPREEAGELVVGPQAKPKAPALAPTPAPPDDAKATQGHDKNAAVQEHDKAGAGQGLSKGSSQAPRQAQGNTGETRKKPPRVKSRRYR